VQIAEDIFKKLQQEAGVKSSADTEDVDEILRNELA